MDAELACLGKCNIYPQTSYSFSNYNFYKKKSFYIFDFFINFKTQYNINNIAF